MEKMSLCDRMKQYEIDSEKGCVSQRNPVVIRLDGCHFHTWVKSAKLHKPFDRRMVDAMQTTALALCNEIQSSVMAYVQSDEISLVLRNDQSENSDPWFGNRIQKLCSISASMCSVAFNNRMAELTDGEAPLAYFDSRVIFLPSKEEVFNCLLWRQRDCIRNSISGLAQANFSHRELDKKSSDEKKEMLLERGIDWESLKTDEKYGAVVRREARTGVYNGTEFIRKVFFVDCEFGKVGMDKFLGAYDFNLEDVK